MQNTAKQETLSLFSADIVNIDEIHSKLERGN